MIVTSPFTDLILQAVKLGLEVHVRPILDPLGQPTEDFTLTVRRVRAPHVTQLDTKIVYKLMEASSMPADFVLSSLLGKSAEAVLRTTWPPKK